MILFSLYYNYKKLLKISPEVFLTNSTISLSQLKTIWYTIVFLCTIYPDVFFHTNILYFFIFVRLSVFYQPIIYILYDSYFNPCLSLHIHLIIYIFLHISLNLHKRRDTRDTQLEPTNIYQSALVIKILINSENLWSHYISA